METFPLMMDEKEWETLNKINLPKNIPISFVKQFEKQIDNNHYQTIKRLKERGGLCPTELCACIYNIPFHTYWGYKKITSRQKQFALNMISMKLTEFNKLNKEE